MKKPRYPGLRLCAALAILVAAAAVAHRSHRLAGRPGIRPRVALGDTGGLAQRSDGRELLEEFTRPGSPLVLSELGFADPPVIFDETGDASDWVEITNVSLRAVDLSGWRLGFGPRLATTWNLPDLTLPSGESLILWLSGGHRVSSALARPCDEQLSEFHQGEVLVTAPAGRRPDFHDRPPPPRSVRVQVQVPEGLSAQLWLKAITDQDAETFLDVGLDGQALETVRLGGPGDHVVRVASPAGPRTFALEPGVHEITVRCAKGQAQLRYVSLVDDVAGHGASSLHAHLPEAAVPGDVLQLLAPHHEIMDRLKVPVPSPGLTWQLPDSGRGRRRFAPPTPRGVPFAEPPPLEDVPFHSPVPVTVAPPARPDGLSLRFTLDGRVPGPLDAPLEVPLTLERPGLLRVRGFRGDQPATAVVTRHFWIGELPDLPVVMVCLDQDQLIGDNLGIDTNSALRGAEWERVADVKMFQGDQTWMDGLVGLRIHAGIGVSLGNWTPFRLHARGRFGADRLLTNPFDPDALPPKQVLVDPSYDWMFDHLAYSMVNAAGGLAPRTRPILVYFNGSLHGLGGLVERVDEDFLADRFGHTDFDLLKGKPWEVKRGNEQRLSALADRLREEEGRTLEALEPQVDFRSLCLLHCVVVLAATVDGEASVGEAWQGYMAMERRTRPGRLYFVAWDLDGSLQTPELNPLPVLRESMTRRGWQGRFLGIRLVEELLISDPDFRDRYLRTVESTWNHALAARHWHPVLEELEELLDTWGQPQRSLYEAANPTRMPRYLTLWHGKIATARRCLDERPDLLFQALADQLGLAPPRRVQVQAPDSRAFQVDDEEVRGPWQGIYLEGGRVRLSVPEAGRSSFRGFRVNGRELDGTVLDLAVTEDLRIELRFRDP